VVEGDVGEVVGYLLYGDDVMEEHHMPMGGGDPWPVSVPDEKAMQSMNLRMKQLSHSIGGDGGDPWGFAARCRSRGWGPLAPTASSNRTGYRSS